MPLARFATFAGYAGASSIDILDAFLYPFGTVRDRLPTEDELDTALAGAAESLLRAQVTIDAVAVTNNFVFNDPMRWEVEVSKIDLGTRLASKFGASVVRVFAGDLPDDWVDAQKADQRVFEGLCRAVEDAADKGVSLGLENHGRTYGAPEAILDLLDRVQRTTGSDALGVTFDIGNFALSGHDPVEAARLLAPHVKLIHVKDFSSESLPYDILIAEDNLSRPQYNRSDGLNAYGCPIGEGWVPILPTLQALRASGSLLEETPVLVEYEGGLDCRSHIPAALERVNGFLAQCGIADEG